MPWRKRPKLLEELRERLGDKEALQDPSDLVAFMELLVEKIWSAMRLVLGAALVLVVICIALQYQVTARNKIIDKIDSSANRIEASANATHDLVQNAITAGGPQAEASAKAIRNIEKLCEQLGVNCEK